MVVLEYMNKIPLITDYLVRKSSGSDKLFGILIGLMVLNFFVPDMIPYVDELVSIPVILALIQRIEKAARKKRT